MKLAAIGLTSASALMLFLCGACASKPMPVRHAHGTVPRAITLYDQNSDDAGVAVPSTYDAYAYQGTWGADDFEVPEGHRWTLSEVKVSGRSGLSARRDPDLSENVYIYTDGGDGLPQHLIREQDYIKGREHNGSFAIPFYASLEAGRYWISVAVVTDRFSYGDWAWETRSTRNNDPAVWETTEDYKSECFEHWGVMTSCVDIGERPDFMFALKGNDEGAMKVETAP